MTRSRLAALSGDDLERIHEATLELLGNTGVLVREPRARNLLTDAGARAVDRSDRLLLPSSLVKEAVAKAPKAWTWHARESRYDLRIGDGGRTKLGPGSSCTNYVDLAGERTLLQEAHERAGTVLSEHIDELHSISELLIERETIDKDQFERLLAGEPDESVFPEPEPEPEKEPERKPRTKPKPRPFPIPGALSQPPPPEGASS